MGKSSKANLPQAPVVYINDPAVDMRHARHFADMIPSSKIVFLSQVEMPKGCPVQGRNLVASDIRRGEFDKSVGIINETLQDSNTQEKIETAVLLREEAIKHGSNFVSVNLYREHPTPAEDKDKWGTNHLEFCTGGGMSEKQIAERVYHWLFKVFAVQESLHLIPESEMLAIDPNVNSGYEYCAISDCKNRRKNEKVQFVALIVSKPVVGPGQKLSWSVADRSGTATFYFQYRGPESQPTWDWILALQPGDRRQLPRMPSTEVKERKTVRVIKAPFRTVGFVVQCAGLTVGAVGHGVAKVGELTRLGKSSEWVLDGDMVNGKKVSWPAVFEKQGHAEDARIDKAKNAALVKVFNEKGEKTWKDDDSAASTAGGDEDYDFKFKE